MGDFDFKVFFHNLRYEEGAFSRRAYFVHPRVKARNWEIEKRYYWPTRNVEIVESSINVFFAELQQRLKED